MASLAASLPIALLTLLGEGLLSILVARIATGGSDRRAPAWPLVRRTRSSTDDWILQVVVGSIPSFGWVLSAVLAWRILTTSVESDRLTLDLAKQLNRQAPRTADAAVASMALPESDVAGVDVGSGSDLLSAEHRCADTSAVIANYGDMQERRLIHRLGISYDTDAERLGCIPGMLEEIVSRCGEPASIAATSWTSAPAAWISSWSMTWPAASTRWRSMCSSASTSTSCVTSPVRDSTSPSPPEACS